jgi:ADP-heptose:LPS heptosyltransferase
MLRILFAPIFPGELGWEIINYVPYINYLCSLKQYHEVHIEVRPGREALYPMGTHFYSVALDTHKAMGNNGPSGSSKAYKKLKKQKYSIDLAKVPHGGCSYVKNRKFLKYEATSESLSKWDLPSNAVSLLVRGRKKGSHKNLSLDYWLRLCEFLVDQSYTPIISGLKETIDLGSPQGCINLQDQTTMADLIAILQKSRFAIGQSTGPAHLASLCGIPHAVWGAKRIKERYISSWNPYNTMVEYHSCSHEFECSFEEIISLTKRLIERLKNGS